MKHDQLCAIAHNMADSLASGLCFLIGYWAVDVFGEAAAAEDGVIEVDFLNGTITRGQASDNLKKAVRRFSEVLPTFCRDNGADVGDFASLQVTFEANRQRQATVVIVDREGRGSETIYVGNPLKRRRILDYLGRIRREPRSTITAPERI